MKKTMILILALLFAAGVAEAKRPKQAEQAQQTLQSRQEVRNVIYMIGDGMGLAHMSMLKIEGGYAPTAFDRAEGVALITTYSANNRVTDSAAAGTALAAGSKTGNGMLGVDIDGNKVQSMMRRATDEGMATGIVVTCYLQHATPAAFYAHVGSRSSDEEITRDMLESGVDVLMGGGSRLLSAPSPEGGSYFDAFRSRGYTVIDTLPAADTMRAGRLLGVFAEKDMPHAPERGDYLTGAVVKTLDILSNSTAQSEKGFLLMVEGSQIDHASHANDPSWLLAEMRDFDRAVTAAMDFADRTPGTLVVVVADHETGGLAMPSKHPDFTRSESGLTYVFGSKSHTGIHVLVYLYGAGADRIRGVMDNTELSKKIMEILSLE